MKIRSLMSCWRCPRLLVENGADGLDVEHVWRDLWNQRLGLGPMQSHIVRHRSFALSLTCRRRVSVQHLADDSQRFLTFSTERSSYKSTVGHHEATLLLVVAFGDCGFFFPCEDFWRMFEHSLPVFNFFFLLKWRLGRAH